MPERRHPCVRLGNAGADARRTHRAGRCGLACSGMHATDRTFTTAPADTQLQRRQLHHGLLSLEEAATNTDVAAPRRVGLAESLSAFPTIRLSAPGLFRLPTVRLRDAR